MGIGIILDLIIIGIIALSTFLGYKKGLTKSFLKIFSFLIAIVVSFILFKPIANVVISQTDLVDRLQTTISSTFKNEESSKKLEQKNDNELKENEEKDFSNMFYKYIEDKVVESVTETKDYVIDNASKQIAIIIINIGVFIILFIIIRIALIFVKALAELITKLPVIKQFDEAGGGIFGFLRACIIILFAFTILSIIMPIIPGAIIQETLDQTIISKLIYENNIILKLIL